MIAAFPAEQSKIFDYNRVIKNLNGLSKHDFLDKLKENFKVTISDVPLLSLKVIDNLVCTILANGIH